MKAAVGALVLALAACSSPSPVSSPTAATPTPAPSAALPLSGVENVVFILADDLDWETFSSSDRLAKISADGMTFTNFTVTASLCCPSRASILRSQYVHNHNVVSNSYKSGGGWQTFNRTGDEADCLPVWLKAAGVTTGYFGKYLNGYGKGASASFVPPGWDEWLVPLSRKSMYRGFGYSLNHNGQVSKAGSKSFEFLTDVTTAGASEFISKASSPFYVQLNVTNPHAPYPSSKANADALVSGLDLSNANNIGSGAPAWRADLPVLSKAKLRALKSLSKARVRSALSVADSYDAVVAALTLSGKLDSTLIVVGSDNGYHVASRRITTGKRTPYDEDTVVPYVFIAPGIPPGSTSSALASTIDLGPTFAELLGASAPTWVDGISLTPALAGGSWSPSRTGVLTESLSVPLPGDPDFESFSPPPFRSLRTDEWLFVSYSTKEEELFSLTNDPKQLVNVADAVKPEVLDGLRADLARLSVCAGLSCQ